MRDTLLAGAQARGDAGSRFEFYPMPLTVIERQAITVESLLPGNGEACGGIESAAEQANCFKLRRPLRHADFGDTYHPYCIEQGCVRRAKDSIEPMEWRVTDIIDRPVRLCFLTSTPLNVVQGSGTYSGIVTLVGALRKMGVDIEIGSPEMSIRPYVLRRLLFNRDIARRDFTKFDATVGFDLDGFLLRNPKAPHIACLKGVIADEARFETGLSRASLQLQTAWEKRHVNRASLVVTTSQYSANCIEHYYGRAGAKIVPELIDLAEWRRWFGHVPRASPQAGVRLLTVCRFYPRKNLPLLMRCLAILRSRGRYELRIVGDGPEGRNWRALSAQLGLQDCVTFLGDRSQEELAAEYAHADIFCFPSLQEGFGIVLLEAMAAGKPIVASDQAAIPEIVPHAALVQRNHPEAWADAIEKVASDPELRLQMSRLGEARVTNYDAGRVARVFLETIRPVLDSFSSRGAEFASAAVQ